MMREPLPLMTALIKHSVGGGVSELKYRVQMRIKWSQIVTRSNGLNVALIKNSFPRLRLYF